MNRSKILLRYGFGVIVLVIVGRGVIVASTPSVHAADSLKSSAVERFVLIMGGEAAKDSKTGLTWEQTPDAFHGVWSESIDHCLEKTVGGEKGWRLPTVKELASLTDSGQRDPALPPGHPFSNVKSAIFWSATPSATDDILAWHVSFLSGEVVTDQKSQTRRAWCVMGEPSIR
jgi:hypothetical protein